jgi:hypothetical protein
VLCCVVLCCVGGGSVCVLRGPSVLLPARIVGGGDLRRGMGGVLWCAVMFCVLKVAL